MEKRNNLYEKALECAKNVVLLYKILNKNGVEIEILKQFLRSGTSVGANVAEAQGSISEADYLSKIHIAYKELLETKYWLELIEVTQNISTENQIELKNNIDEVSKILYTIIKNINKKRS